MCFRRSKADTAFVVVRDLFYWPANFQEQRQRRLCVPPLWRSVAWKSMEGFDNPPLSQPG